MGRNMDYGLIFKVRTRLIKNDLLWSWALLRCSFCAREMFNSFHGCVLYLTLSVV